MNIHHESLQGREGEERTEIHWLEQLQHLLKRLLETILHID